MSKRSIPGKSQAFQARIHVTAYWNDNLKLTERLYLLLGDFAKKEERTVPMSRVLMSEILLGPANEANHKKISEALRGLVLRGLVKVIDQPEKASGRTFNETAFTYKVIDPVADPSREELALAALNRFSKYREYVRPSEYVHEERPDRTPDRATSGKALNIPDLYVPRSFVKHPCFASMFEATEETRKSWHTISSYVDPSILQLFILGCDEYFLGKKDWNNRPIEEPARILCSMAKRFKDARDNGQEWQDKFPDKFVATLRAVTPKLETVASDAGNLRLRDLTIDRSN